MDAVVAGSPETQKDMKLNRRSLLAGLLGLPAMALLGKGRQRRYEPVLMPYMRARIITTTITTAAFSTTAVGRHSLSPID